MYQKCSLLIQSRVVNSSELLRKKQSDLMGTKCLELSDKLQTLLSGHRNILDTVTYICV